MLDPTQLVGEQLKQYRIEAHIDRGGMADVYLAHDVNLQRKVAFKIMLPAFAHDKQFVDRHAPLHVAGAGGRPGG